MTLPAGAANYTSNPQAVDLIQRFLEQDFSVSRGGGKGVFKLPAGESREQFIGEVTEWLLGESPNLAPVPAGQKAYLFAVHWVAAGLPESSTCFQDINDPSCETDLSQGMRQVKSPESQFLRDYAAARVPLGLPDNPLAAMSLDQLAALPAALPMPHPKTMEIADNQCDDLVFSSGRDGLSEACKQRNHRGFNNLLAMRSDAEIRIEFWAACQNAVGFRVSTEFMGWSQCVKFVRSACPSSKVKGDGDVARCLRAIQSGGWILNRAAQ
ncbi:hypothetical protein ACJBUE_20220 (plasmid) [Ralstonia syzygii subsp. celebesensis]|uniref:hypothetical protein n=1 Tax=Ralstonia syzygii TaxID=28097 RepID=UPI00387E1E75